MAFQLLSWAAFKATKDNNTGKNIYYLTEDQYVSNDASIPDIERYFMILTIDSLEYQSCITIEDPPSSDQTDWEDNYKSAAIEI